jgi:pimeloyl-ACP methyl ester carboxylesterase
MPRTKSEVPIAFDDQGLGEPALLCLPGWCVDRSAFRELVPACSRARRTLSLDWRGHGQSASTEGDFGEKDLIEDALAVIHESGAQRVIPVALRTRAGLLLSCGATLGTESRQSFSWTGWFLIRRPPSSGHLLPCRIPGIGS